MEITMGGNTFDLASGAAIVSPPAIEARDSITALWMTMLPAVRAVISRPSRIDTPDEIDRKSTRLNSSHTVISYAVFCLKKKTTKNSSEIDKAVEKGITCC